MKNTSILIKDTTKEERIRDYQEVSEDYRHHYTKSE